uniref:Uncharacterized protein n=1 Tax=Oryza sativa subsp. japonica TaxID=39947 RepID=Q6EPZ1_ORYSJ|nr:hypothetical protein [Oryza sativa Japonica Group]
MPPPPGEPTVIGAISPSRRRIRVLGGGSGRRLNAAVLLPPRRCGQARQRRGELGGGGLAESGDGGHNAVDPDAASTPSSCSPHDSTDELADGVASLAAAGLPDPGTGSPDPAAGNSGGDGSNDDKKDGEAVAGSSDNDCGGSGEATTTTTRWRFGVGARGDRTR